ncbi:hypothetical protein [Campylobacter phage CJLB-5]|nr:hypothetical protein [Campylobacter phage CJLB-5]
MKPRRYPYTGRLKKPARLMIKEWQQHYDNYLQTVGRYKKTGSNIKPEEIPGYQEPVFKFDRKRLNAIEFKSDGLTINRI